MGNVIFRAGNILARGADMTVLPCSDLGLISAETKSHLEHYGISPPGALSLGSISVRSFPGSVSITKWIAFAASVANRSSSTAVIRQIGQELGDYISVQPEIRVVESPLLGTGVGGLEVAAAGLALRDGFQTSCQVPAVLFIYCFYSDLVKQLNGTRSDTNAKEITTASSGASVWGVFIAHGRNDNAAAEQLYDALGQGIRVFLDNRSLQPGDDWDLELPQALRQSAVTVVLVSSSTGSSHYQREEIAAAIQRARTDPARHCVIPVVLDPDGVGTDLPYGLGVKQRIEVRNTADLHAAAKRIVDATARLGRNRS